jgi:hypothetical protein
MSKLFEGGEKVRLAFKVQFEPDWLPMPLTLVEKFKLEASQFKLWAIMITSEDNEIRLIERRCPP